MTDSKNSNKEFTRDLARKVYGTAVSWNVIL